MAKKKKALKLGDTVFISAQRAQDLVNQTHYSAYAALSVEDLVVAHEDEEVPLDGDVIEVALYEFVGITKYKKERYKPLED